MKEEEKRTTIETKKNIPWLILFVAIAASVFIAAVIYS